MGAFRSLSLLSNAVTALGSPSKVTQGHFGSRTDQVFILEVVGVRDRKGQSPGLSSAIFS